MQPNITVQPPRIRGVYTATLQQNSTNIPVATELTNTLKDTPTWTRIINGEYQGTFTKPWFTDTTKVYFTITNLHNGDNNYVIVTVDNYTIQIMTFTGTSLQDDLLTETPIEIRIYK